MIVLAVVVASVAFTLYAVYAAVVFHVRALQQSRSIAKANMIAVKLLADEMKTIAYARDYYRAALTEIATTTDANGEAAGIARRFLAMDDRA